MNCPKCDGSLNIKEHEGHVGFHCNSCHGILLSKKYLLSLELTYKFSASEFISSLSSQQSCVTAYKCIECTDHLHEITIDGFEIDFCKSCNGVWFDKSELSGLITKNKLNENSSVWATGFFDVLFGIASSF